MGEVFLMKIAIYLFLASLACTQLTGQTAPTAQVGAMSTNASPDLALRESLVMAQAMAQKSDADVARLRIEKWKADSENKRQSAANAASIRRNLTNAIPDLLARIQSEPGSLIANFRMYRNLNALYDSFSALAESAGAFGPPEQYAPLAADIAQLDQLRRDFAQRVDLMAGTYDVELARLRTAVAAKPAAPQKTAVKIVQDDSHPAPKKKPKPSVAKPASAKPAAAAEPTANAATDNSQPKKQKPSPYPAQTPQP